MDVGAPNNFNQRAGLFGGLMLVLIVNLSEIARTAVLAGVGAAVSFSVSALFKWILRKAEKIRRNGH